MLELGIERGSAADVERSGAARAGADRAVLGRHRVPSRVGERLHVRRGARIGAAGSGMPAPVLRASVHEQGGLLRPRDEAVCRARAAAGTVGGTSAPAADLGPTADVGRSVPGAARTCAAVVMAVRRDHHGAP